MKKKTLENVKIETLGYGGVGIGQLENGKKVLVKGGLPRSVVDGRVIKRKKDFVEIQITKVHSYDPSLMETTVLCPHYLFPYAEKTDTPLQKRGCGGCKRQALSYATQLTLKYQMVADSLRKVPACQAISLPEVLPSPLLMQYRNKIEFSFGSFRVRDDELTESVERSATYTEYSTVGFHQQGRFAQVIDVDQCFLISEQMHNVFQRLKSDLIASGLPFYRIMQHTGLLRHLVIRAGTHTRQVMAHLSIASHWFEKNPQDLQVRKSLLQTREQDAALRTLVTTLIITENNGLADAVLHPEATSHTARGPGYIFEELHIREQILRFQISPFSFFQTNTLGAELLFTTALEMVGKKKGRILDLYCGSGTIGLSFLQCGVGSDVVGIEVVADAIHDAAKNAEINGLLEKSRFFTGKVEHLIHTDNEVKNLLTDIDLVIVDPPREGLHGNVVSFLIDLRKKQKATLLYISCNPVTFARDLHLLTSAGWELEALQPVDMFPQTYHVEMIGVLK